MITLICLLGYYYYENKLLRVVFCNEKHFIMVSEWRKKPTPLLAPLTDNVAWNEECVPRSVSWSVSSAEEITSFKSHFTRVS